MRPLNRFRIELAVFFVEIKFFTNSFRQAVIGTHIIGAPVFAGMVRGIVE